FFLSCAYCAYVLKGVNLINTIDYKPIFYTFIFQFVKGSGTCNISDSSTTCNVVAAVILPDNSTYEISQKKVMPVLEVARKFVSDNNWLPSNVNLSFLSLDDRCSNVYSILSALSAYSHCAHVLLGPACEYALGKSYFYVNLHFFKAVTCGPIK
ncbi:hypothetical protein L9F63_012914, partial [Diploptera punctata]